MHRLSSRARSDHRHRQRSSLFRLMRGVPAALALFGCHHAEPNDYISVTTPQTVQLIQPQIRDIVRVIGQPSFTQSYERSSVYPKMNAYIEKWVVDIGDKVKKGDVLARLFVPELVEDHRTKKATVALDQEKVALRLRGAILAPPSPLGPCTYPAPVQNSV